MVRARKHRAELKRQADVEKIISEAIQLRERVAVLGEQLQVSVSQLRSEIDRFAVSVGTLRSAGGYPGSDRTSKPEQYEPAGEEGAE